MFTKAELHRERVQLEAKYSAAMNLAEKYRRAIEGLDALVAVSLDPLAEPEAAVDSKVDSVPEGPVVSKVLDVLEQISEDGTFTLRDVIALLAATFDGDVKKKSISQVLRSLAKDGIIEVEEAGVGRRPSVYRKRSGLLLPSPKAA